VRPSLSIDQLFLVILLVGVFTMAMRPVTDPDLWWHLKTGEFIAANHHVPRTDPFSFTRAGQPWVNHEWLSDWLIFKLYQYSGLAGLDAVFGAVLTLALFVVFLRACGSPFVAGLFTVWGAIASAPSWGVRPQMLSLLLASTFLWILERTERNPKAAWWMPALMLLWVNLHAGYVLGMALIVLFAMGLALEVACGRRLWAEISGQIRALGIALIACCAIVPLNPNGLKLYWYPFATVRSHAMQAYIAEWFSPNFHEAKFLPFLLIVLAIVVFMASAPRRMRTPQLLLLMATTWMALHASRHIPIFVLVAVPVLCGLAEPTFASRVVFRRKSGHNVVNQAMNYAVLCALLVFATVRTRAVIQSLSEVEAQNFPAEAVRFVQEQHLAGPILNHYNWGGYLIWKLYPRYRVFIDGRADVYGDKFMDQFAELYYVKKSDWGARLNDYGIQTVMMPPDAPLVGALELSKSWSRVYADSQVVILTRDQQASSLR